MLDHAEASTWHAACCENALLAACRDVKGKVWQVEGDKRLVWSGGVGGAGYRGVGCGRDEGHLVGVANDHAAHWGALQALCSQQVGLGVRPASVHILCSDHSL